MNRETLFELLPAYALDALDAEERAEVEAALASETFAGDIEVQEALAHYEQIAVSLLLTVPAQPAPEHLSQDLQRRLRLQRLMPPVVQPEPEPPLSVLPSVDDLSRVNRGRFSRRVWIAAALLVAVLIPIIYLLSQPRVSDPERLYQEIASAADMQRMEITPGAVSDAVTGDLMATGDGRMAVIRVANLPELPPDQTFQIWMIEDSGVHSGGTFRVEPSAQPYYLMVPMEDSLHEYTAIGVSIEPEGGSPYGDRPSGPRVFVVPAPT